MCVKCRLNRELSAGRKEIVKFPAVHKPHPAATEMMERPYLRVIHAGPLFVPISPFVV